MTVPRIAGHIFNPGQISMKTPGQISVKINITGFDTSSTTDEIVLSNATYSASADSVTLESGNTLRLNLGGTIANLHFDKSQSFVGDTFYLTSNSAGQVVILDPPVTSPMVPDLAGLIESLWLSDEAVLSLASRMAFISGPVSQTMSSGPDFFGQAEDDSGGFLGTYSDTAAQLSGTSVRAVTMSATTSVASFGALTNRPLQSGTQVSTYVHSGVA